MTCCFACADHKSFCELHISYSRVSSQQCAPEVEVGDAYYFTTRETGSLSSGFSLDFTLLNLGVNVFWG